MQKTVKKTMINYRRNPVIDVVKGIAIIMVVWGHTVWTAGDKPETNFIYLFHMALFYIASGYTYKNDYEESFKSVLLFIKKELEVYTCRIFFGERCLSYFTMFF